MRLFLVFIVLLNLLYAAWQFLNPSVTDSSIAPLPDNLQTLELLRETRVSPEAEGEDNRDLQRTGENSDELAIADMVPDNVALDDVASGDAGKEAEVVELAVSCYTLGPFKDKEIMQQLKISLSEHVQNMSVRKLRESEKHRYWVYIPSLGSRKRARQMVERLRGSQIKDFYIILNGDARNGVSLGHFKEPLHANRRYKKVKDLGFNAEIKVIYRDFDVYWLDYQFAGVQAEGSFSIQEYVTEGVSQLERQCK